LTDFYGFFPVALRKFQPGTKRSCYQYKLGVFQRQYFPAFSLVKPFTFFSFAHPLKNSGLGLEGLSTNLLTMSQALLAILSIAKDVPKGTPRKDPPNPPLEHVASYDMFLTFYIYVSVKISVVVKKKLLNAGQKQQYCRILLISLFFQGRLGE